VNQPTELTELMHAVLDGEASESEARQLELRLAADPAARAEFDEWQGLFQALREMPKEYPAEGLVAAVSAALPTPPARSSARSQPFPPRRVFGYTSTRTPGSRLGDLRAIQPPTPPTRSVSMSQQSRFFASRKSWLGAGIVAAAAVVVAQLGFDFPVAKDVMGTVAPAQRYRAAPNGSEDVKLAPATTPGAAIGTVPEANRAVAGVRPPKIEPHEGVTVRQCRRADRHLWQASRGGYCTVPQSSQVCNSKRPSAAAAVMPSATRPRAQGGRFICRVRRTGFLRLGFISGIVMRTSRAARRRCRGTGRR